MRKRRLRFLIDENDDFWSILSKLHDEIEKQKPRKRFSKGIKQSVLANQNLE